MWETPSVEIVRMTDKGQVTIPKKARDKKGYGPGTAFMYVETKSSDVVFRPVNKKPKLSLIARLKRFKGLEMPRIKAHCPPRI
jgi:AbrB family looped-hinge helix DNA binding protein